MEETGTADLDVARQDGAANRRPDGGVREILGRPVGRRLSLRHLRGRLGDAGLAHRQLRLGGAPAVFGHIEGALRIVERGLRDETLREERPRPLERAPRELDVGPFGFDDVLLELGGGALERRPRRQKVGLRAAELRHQLILVELDEHVAFVDHAVDVDAKRLDDAVRLGLDFDFRDGLDLAGRDDRSDDGAALGRREP